MIKINLATKKQSALVTGSGDTNVSVLLAKLGVSGANVDSIKSLPVRRFIVPLAMYLIAAQFSDIYKKQLLDELDVVVVKEKGKVTKLEAEAAKLKDYERLKLGLEGDEAVIRKKMTIINSLLKERAVKLNLLIELSKATPVDVWFTSVHESNNLLQIKGRTEKFNSLPDFLSNLSGVKFIQSVILKNSSKRELKQAGNDSTRGSDSSSLNEGESSDYVEFEVEAGERS